MTLRYRGAIYEISLGCQSGPCQSWCGADRIDDKALPEGTTRIAPPNDQSTHKIRVILGE